MADSQQILSDLSESIGEASIKIDSEILAEYAVDDVKSRAVVFPKNTREVSEVVKYANQKDLAIVPRGSGTKMSMGNPPKRLDLVL
ncbi:MAG: FAD-binding oxidoreductase, partial [Deltaproteobacteria bacterium]|nr:FAD-binding oxidoreductase [Deltaproteobacteria bacterium]